MVPVSPAGALWPGRCRLRLPCGYSAACWAFETVGDWHLRLPGNLAPQFGQSAAGPTRNRRATGPLSEEVLPRRRCAVRSQSDPKRRSPANFCCVAKLLFDHLVGGGQQRFRNGKAEGLGGFAIDD